MSQLSTQLVQLFFGLVDGVCGSVALLFFIPILLFKFLFLLFRLILLLFFLLHLSFFILELSFLPLFLSLFILEGVLTVGCLVLKLSDGAFNGCSLFTQFLDSCLACVDNSCYFLYLSAIISHSFHELTYLLDKVSDSHFVLSDFCFISDYFGCCGCGLCSFCSELSGYCADSGSYGGNSWSRKWYCSLGSCKLSLSLS